MKTIIHIIILILIVNQLYCQVNGDNWNNREISDYQNDSEVARVSIKFLSGFNTTGHTEFIGYIDPSLPMNGGEPVTDGEFDKNYIRIFSPKKDNSTTTIPVHGSIDYSLWNENITYYDGLGKKTQLIDVKASPFGNDIVSPIIYDGFGRQEYTYLPYVIAQDGNDGPGGFRNNPVDENRTFYSNYFGDQDGAYAFYQTEFEQSPRNLKIESSSPGYDWKMEGDGATKNFDYLTNAENEIKRYSVMDGGYLRRDDYYPANSLYISQITDEDEKQLLEYKNGLGQVILKKGERGTETYYVYDDFGLLRYVIPPLGADGLGTDNGLIGDITHSVIKNYCFYYEYDKRKRLIIKKIPGASEIYTIYNDDRDLPVLSQDGEQRLNNEWSFTKYDELNRPIITGIYTNSTTTLLSDMQDLANATQYSIFESYATGGGYSNTAFPIINQSTEIYEYLYYDTYDAVSLENTPSDYNFLSTEVSFQYPKSDLTRGLPTVSNTKVLLNNGETIDDEWLLCVNYYDVYGRVIQSICDNHLGGKDIISSIINYSGDILQTMERHIVGTDENIIQQKFEYNNANQLIRTEHKIDSRDWIILNQYKYTELGTLYQKKLHGENDNFVQSIEYKYNIKNWLTDINNIGNVQDDFFAMHIEYNSDDIYSHLNGNISSISWQSNIFQDIIKYSFQYDGLNMLTDAIFEDEDSYTTHYEYDKNGNILALTRNSVVNNNIVEIDNLTYSYESSNLLTAVDDGTGSAYENNGFKDNGVYLQTEYLYNTNGSMYKDLNKGIDDIKYNYLNLPFKISISLLEEDKEILFTYAANGVKIRKQTVENGSSTIRTDYSGSYVYENGLLIYINTSEGRLIPDGSSFNYEYSIQDHQGNNRVMFNEDGVILQDNSYYPFGMSMGESLTYMADNHLENKYLYNGKEIQTDFKLGWYDYGARFYDPAIGRWNVIDPMVEHLFKQNPYNFLYNSPILNVDPYGMESFRIWDIDENNAFFKREDNYSGNKNDQIIPDKDGNLPTVYVDAFRPIRTGGIWFTSSSNIVRNEETRRSDGTSINIDMLLKALDLDGGFFGYILDGCYWVGSKLRNSIDSLFEKWNNVDSNVTTEETPDEEILEGNNKKSEEDNNKTDSSEEVLEIKILEYTTYNNGYYNYTYKTRAFSRGSRYKDSVVQVKDTSKINKKFYIKKVRKNE